MPCSFHHLTSLLGFRLPASCGIASASTHGDLHSAPYHLAQEKTGEERVVLRVVRRSTGKTVWKYTAPILWGFAWSPDHQMLALFVEKQNPSSEEGNYRLVLWRAGQRTRYYDNLASLRYLDGVQNPTLSPDKKRLAFLGFWSQGQIDIGGFLYVLPIPLKPRHFVYSRSPDPPMDARRAQNIGLLRNAGVASRITFVGRRRIRIWSREGDKTGERTIACP